MFLLYACVLTVLIETAFFAALGYRGRDDLIIVAGTNAASNLLLNLALMLLGAYSPGFGGSLILILELIVVAAEYIVYALAFGRSKKLFALTALANILSFSLGALCNMLLLR